MLAEADRMVARITAPPGSAWLTGDGAYLAVARAWIAANEPERARTVLAPMLMTIFAIVAIEVPTALFLEPRIGVDGIWWAYPAAFCSMFVMQGAYYGLVWRKKRVERLI